MYDRKLCVCNTLLLVVSPGKRNPNPHVHLHIACVSKGFNDTGLHDVIMNKYRMYVFAVDKKGKCDEQLWYTHDIDVMMTQQGCKQGSCKSYAWGLHMHDGTPLQWSCHFALCNANLRTSSLHSFFKWLHSRAEEDATYIFLQSLWAPDRLNCNK